MQAFVVKFREEVRDYLERLESGLLLLENEPENYQVIDEIFRIMHSMKGSGGMFGFDLISEVTHDLESLYEIFRSKKQRIDSEAISFTLNSIDILQNLMIQEPNEEHHLLADQLKSDTQVQISRLTKTDSVIQVGENISVATEKKLQPNLNTYYISFIPDEHIFESGTNPLYLVDELNALGECNIQVSFDRLPKLTEIDPVKCYTTWYLFIATSESIETLHDVFIFVADSAQIKIEKVSSGNVIHNDNILANYLNSDLFVPDKPNNQILGEIEKKSVQNQNAEPVVTEESVTEILKNRNFTQPKVDSIKVDSQKIDQYMNLVSELITTQSRLQEISLGLKFPELDLLTETFEKLSRQLRDNAFEMSLVPLQSITVRFDRLVHDLSKSLDKEVRLVTEGMETELDKNIIDQLGEPLMHIIRNSLDHGIESKNERQQLKKEQVGTISIKASTIGSSVQIVVEDDGAGLDLDKIREKAIKKGIIHDHSNLSDEETSQLIFRPGFSTSETITDVSGRGVGMDVVSSCVQALRGSVELKTKKNSFTRFTIKLPLSLSIVDSLLILVGVNYYVIPSSSIDKIYLIKSKKLKKEFKQLIKLDRIEMPFINLHHEFNCITDIPEEQVVVVVVFEKQFFGLVVDEVIREFQAVIKPLGKVFQSQEVFSGASILGNGQLALVIDTNRLIQKYS